MTHLPVSPEEFPLRGWYFFDFLLITGDAYVDHPSFGVAVISRVLEAAGYRVAILAQPRWGTAEDVQKFPKPRLGVLITAGNIDSMVAHYTAAKKRRSEDFYSPGKKTGLRPDRAAIVYAQRAREAFPDTAIILGGLEASLRRFAHYDYWSDKVRRSILLDAKADLLVFGMGEAAILSIAHKLKRKTPVREIRDVSGTAWIASFTEDLPAAAVYAPSFEAVQENKRAYAEATRLQIEEHDPFHGQVVVQKHGERYLVVNPPAKPLDTRELDRIAALPYMREPHPSYIERGGVPAIEEVRFSLAHNRGCFGNCNFCALAFHQGRIVSARSHESLLREAETFTQHPLWKGYIHDVGGPTANFRRPACAKQGREGACRNRQCLAPEPCPALDADHGDYLKLLRKLRKIPGVKKVFVRSGIRFDFLLQDETGEFFNELVHHHVSGQLKVAPEHMVDHVLSVMGKPKHSTFMQFVEKFRRLTQKADKEQYLVPYSMSSHPGSTIHDAIALAEMLHGQGRHPEQVQDFYPTPGTVSTCMYYTGLDPFSGKEVYVPRGERERRAQRALLQWRKSENHQLIRKILREAGRGDLIGYGKHCLVRPGKD